MAGETSLDLARLENVKRLAGGAIRAACPACRASGADKSGEHLKIEPSGKFGCAANPGSGEHRKEIFRLAGNRNSPPAAKSRIVAAYDYSNASGKLVFQVCRFDPKDFRQRQPDGMGDWTMESKGHRNGFVSVAGNRSRRRQRNSNTFLCEGEKDVLAMVQRGFDATCNPMGAGQMAARNLPQPCASRTCASLPTKTRPGALTHRLSPASFMAWQNPSA